MELVAIKLPDFRFQSKRTAALESNNSELRGVTEASNAHH